ncbi:hypothetical protein BLNAU_3996 [Blattamonas nauphoetae]|uniref:Uncharacterized protein n=1 Tax=Blattamonas nauphoetae TaxID=2049346 RepID=A0ABQ9YB19_9EUKA|nr:hypothetical protein BLNAU_3996 [Blattamonas nauphoetae]
MVDHQRELNKKRENQLQMGKTIPVRIVDSNPTDAHPAMSLASHFDSDASDSFSATLCVSTAGSVLFAWLIGTCAIHSLSPIRHSCSDDILARYSSIAPSRAINSTDVSTPMPASSLHTRVRSCPAPLLFDRKAMRSSSFAACTLVVVDGIVNIGGLDGDELGPFWTSWKVSELALNFSDSKSEVEQASVRI